LGKAKYLYFIIQNLFLLTVPYLTVSPITVTQITVSCPPWVT